MKRKSVFFLGAACFALLVITGVGLLTGDQTVLAQGAAADTIASRLCGRPHFPMIRG